VFGRRVSASGQRNLVEIIATPRPRAAARGYLRWARTPANWRATLPIWVVPLLPQPPRCDWLGETRPLCPIRLAGLCFRREVVPRQHLVFEGGEECLGGVHNVRFPNGHQRQRQTTIEHPKEVTDKSGVAWARGARGGWGGQTRAHAEVQLNQLHRVATALDTLRSFELAACGDGNRARGYPTRSAALRSREIRYRRSDFTRDGAQPIYRILVGLHQTLAQTQPGRFGQKCFLI